MSLLSQFNDARIADNAKVTIASGQTQSSILRVSPASIVGIIFPSNFNPSNISFNVAKTDQDAPATLGGFDGVPLSINVPQASFWLPLLPSLFNGIPILQLITSVAQDADVVIDFLFTPIYQGIHS